jgi:hypothetical protein
MVEHHRQGRRPGYFRLNQEIHLGLVAAAHNPTLKATHAVLMAKAGGSRYIALMSPERWAEAVAEHEGLMQALADRDPRPGRPDHAPARQAGRRGRRRGPARRGERHRPRALSASGRRRQGDRIRDCGGF